MIKKKKIPSWLRSIGVGVAVFLGLVIFAYGFEVTQVNLEETRSERRQTQLVRVLRALAQPDILAYDQAEVEVNSEIKVPCPTGGFEPQAPDTSKAYIVVTPACAEPGAVVTVEGFNFAPGTSGPLNFIPPSGVKLQMGEIKVDNSGQFVVEGKLPKRPNQEVQQIRAVTRQRVGGPHLSQSALNTWDRIIETVFLALLATTFGTLLAIPLSFLAARNLMDDITSPLLAVSLNLLAIPFGFAVGVLLSRWIGNIGAMLSSQAMVSIASVVVGPLLVFGGLRFALPQEEIARPNLSTRVIRILVLVLAIILSILVLYLLADLMLDLGEELAERMGAFGFIGVFIKSIGDILGMSIAVIAALLGGGVASAFAGRLGKWIVRNTPAAVNKIVMIVTSGAALALFAALIGAVIEWFYQIGDLNRTLWIPAAVGGAVGVIAGVFLKPRHRLPIGMVIYYVSRTIFNTLRSIEAVVWVIVFVIWVGIGPFAGVLALTLHTIAALAKLYSESIESILPGPLEAVTATGANRLQTIIYAVLPQIIPPYISFTMYRWDINVRMSTIIGFAGGGGIGFLLYQNINLLNYRAASVNMVAIAIVVAFMDWLSAKMRERVI